MVAFPDIPVLSFISSQRMELPVPQADLSNQTVIVTGANVGLGLEAARHFVRLGASKVILGCRSIERGDKAKSDIEESTSSKGVVEVWQVDLTSFDSVKDFCKRAEGLDRLDILLENAGIAPSSVEIVQGYESTMTVNVLSTFLMALLMLPILRKSSIKTNVTPHLSIVSSEAHFQAIFSERKAAKIFPAFSVKSWWRHLDRYNTSKLLEILIIRELAPLISESAKAGKPPVILNCTNPGLCESQIARDALFPLSLVIKLLKALFARSTEEGSRTIVASTLTGEETHGKYMSDCKIAQPSSFVRSKEGAQVQKLVYRELLEILEGVQPGIGNNV